MIDILKRLDEIKQVIYLQKNTLTLNEAAAYLGLSKSHLYHLCAERGIPHYKGQGGKFTYFDKTELDNWAKCRKVATAEELESEAATYCLTSKNQRHGK